MNYYCIFYVNVCPVRSFNSFLHSQSKRSHDIAYFLTALNSRREEERMGKGIKKNPDTK